MIILRKLIEVKNHLENLRNHKKTIGFVPTMGALHAGHLSLVEKSKNENEFTMVSIFVNPTQFNNLEDLKNYPRTEHKDIELLKKAGVDFVFLPEVNEVYPNGETSVNFNFNGLENQMEGKFRPGHFNGVGTIVKKFLEIIQPDKAYFGEKDFQQLRIIQQMVENEKLNVEIIPVEIRRETDGLAMSSRNVRLNLEMREEAPLIYEILKGAKKFLRTHTISETKEFVRRQFDQTQLKLEYFEIADEQTLEPVEDKNSNKKLRAFIAVFAGEIRLIDNLALN